MKHGAYVFFTFNGKRQKGRISIEEDNIHLCQDVYVGGTCKEQFGHEWGWAIGKVSKSEQFTSYVRSYNISATTKTAWNKFTGPEVNVAMGWAFTKSRGKSQNPVFSFGCGSVKLTRKQILEFANERDSYLKLVKKRDELQTQVNEETRKVNNWLSEYSDAGIVFTVLKQRNLNPEKVNLERLKRLFG